MLAQIHLLQILVQPAGWKEALLRRQFVRQKRNLGQLRRVRQPRRLRLALPLQPGFADGGDPVGQAIAQAPPPDVLYNNALRDYNGGKTDVATQEFNDYIKFYPNTDLAGNSYFYLAEIQFKAGDFQNAVTNYELVLQNFPGGNKAASAQLNKGLALLELGKQDEGVQELKHVIQRYPRTNEALQAKEKLRKVAPPAPKSH